MPEKAASQDDLPPEARSCRINRGHLFPDEQNLPYEVYRDALGGIALRKSAYCQRGCKTKKVREYVEHIRDGYETIDHVGKGVLDYSETEFYLLAKGNGPADVGRLRYIDTIEQVRKAMNPAPIVEPKAATPKAKPRKATKALADPFAAPEPAPKRTARKATRPLARRVATR